MTFNACLAFVQPTVWTNLHRKEQKKVGVDRDGWINLDTGGGSGGCGLCKQKRVLKKFLISSAATTMAVSHSELPLPLRSNIFSGFSNKKRMTSRYTSKITITFTTSYHCIFTLHFSDGTRCGVL